jgi:hypothetical protein
MLLWRLIHFQNCYALPDACRLLLTSTHVAQVKVGGWQQVMVLLVMMTVMAMGVAVGWGAVLLETAGRQAAARCCHTA